MDIFGNNDLNSDILDIEFQEYTENNNKIGGENETSSDVEKYQNDLYQIFEKASQYGKRLADVESGQVGGEKEIRQKAKRQRPPMMILMADVGKSIKESGKYPDIKRPADWIGIGKIVVEDAKKALGIEKYSEELRKKSLDLAKNTSKYVDIYKKSDKYKGKKGGFDNEPSGYESNYRNYAQSNIWNNTAADSEEDDGVDYIRGLTDLLKTSETPARTYY